MSRRKTAMGTGKESLEATPASSEPTSRALAEAGIATGTQFANVMSALMSDVLGGRVSPGVANAACNAGGKLLKVVEMQYKYGTQSGNQGERILKLSERTAE